MDLPLLYSARPQIEQDFIRNVCGYILSQPIQEKEQKLEWNQSPWAFTFVEGRPDVEINKLEHFACFHSCKVYSKGEYPIFCFVNNVNNFLNNDKDLIEKYNIFIIPIGKITSLEEYSKFMIEDMFFRLPDKIENIFTVSADSFLLKSGAEDWVLNNDFSLIGAKWMHNTGLCTKDDRSFKFPPVNGCNLGFSFRKASKMRAISQEFSKYDLKQWGDTNCPEDAFFSYFSFGTGICKLPTREEMDLFSKDPLSPEDFKNKTSFGFHFFKKNG